MKTVVWFGNAGSRYGDFGLPNLRIARDGIHRAAEAVPIRLLVISNDEAKFKAVTSDFTVPCVYRPWRRDTAMHEIAQADVCIVPNSKDRFSLAKSANRIVLALSLGVPVVATRVPSAEPLRPFLIFDDWAGGLTTYLLDRGRAMADVSAAQPVIEANYSAASMAEQWSQIMAAVPPRAACSGDWLAFAENDQDLREAMRLQRQVLGPSIEIGFTRELAASAPDLFVEVAGSGAAYRLFSRQEILRRRVDLRCASRLITWSDEGHRQLSRALNEIARRSGVSVCSLPDQMADLDRAVGPAGANVASAEG